LEILDQVIPIRILNHKDVCRLSYQTSRRVISPLSILITMPYMMMYFIFYLSIKFVIAMGTHNMFTIYFVCLVSHNHLTQAFVLKLRKGGEMKATHYLRTFHPVHMDLLQHHPVSQSIHNDCTSVFTYHHW
jgi:hypothetical protein